MSKSKEVSNAQTLTVSEQEQLLVNRAENALQTMGSKRKEKVSTVLFKRSAITIAGIVALVGCGSAITGNSVPTVDTPQVAFSGMSSIHPSKLVGFAQCVVPKYRTKERHGYVFSSLSSLFLLR